MNINDIERKHMTFAVQWCQEKWGVSKFKRNLPTLYMSNSKNPINFGLYYLKGNRIVVYINAHKTALDIFSTIIHEYTHYLQDMNKYVNYKNKNYNKHPYEITAYNREKKFKWELKKAVTEYFGKKSHILI